jgi:hypothetical protein
MLCVMQALRVVKHLINKGCSQFQRAMQKNSTSVRYVSKPVASLLAESLDMSPRHFTITCTQLQGAAALSWRAGPVQGRRTQRACQGVLQGSAGAAVQLSACGTAASSIRRGGKPLVTTAAGRSSPHTQPYSCYQVQLPDVLLCCCRAASRALAATQGLWVQASTAASAATASAARASGAAAATAAVVLVLLHATTMVWPTHNLCHRPWALLPLSSAACGSATA